jgi:hemerythrin
MALITWSEKYDVGIAQFDNDHKQLATLLNELEEAMSAGAGQNALGEVLGKLTANTERHFAAEESGMDKYSVPGLPAHKLEHERLRAQVGRFATGLNNGNVALSLRVLDFLRSWLLDHIQRCDQRYSSYLVNRAL